MKKVFLFFVVLVVAGAGLVYVELGSIVKNAVESRAPAMLGAPVSVGLVTLSPFSGQGRVRGLKIGNPKGFSSNSAIEVGDLRVSVELRSLLGSGRVLVREILVDAPQIRVETGPGGTNLQQLERNLDAAAARAGSGSETKGSGESRKVEITLLRVTHAKATAVVAQLSGAPIVAELPPLELRGIGAKSGGATASEAAKEVVSQLTSAAMKAAGGPEALLKRALGGDAGKVLDGLKGLFKK